MSLIKRKRPYGKKVLAKAEDALKVLGERREGVANYAAVYSNPKKPTYYYKNTMCHAGLRMSSSTPDILLKPDLIVSSIWNKGWMRDAERDKRYYTIAERFYNWLINDSMWAEVFVVKDVKKVISSRGFIARTDIPANLLFGALCATRAVWEHPGSVTVWGHLVDEGVDPAFALYICPLLTIVGAYKPKYAYTFRNYSIHHWPLPAYKFAKDALPHYVNRTHESFFKESTYRASLYYSDVNRVWETEDTHKQMKEAYIDTLKALAKRDKRYRVIRIPDSLYRPMTGTLSKAATVKYLKELYKTVMKDY